MTAPGHFGATLETLTRVQGVRGALIVSVSDGLAVAEQLITDVRGAAVAALAASLARRLGRALEAAGAGRAGFWHLQADGGAVLAMPAGADLVLVAVTAPDVNVGLMRLALVRAVERIA